MMPRANIRTVILGTWLRCECGRLSQGWLRLPKPLWAKHVTIMAISQVNATHAKERGGRQKGKAQPPWSLLLRAPIQSLD